MFGLFKRRIRNNNGFTLVEVIIVIAIMGILGAIAVPNIDGFKEVAARKADKATALVIANAARLAYLDGITTTEYENLINELIAMELLDGKPKPQVKGQNGFKVTISTNGTVSVNYDDGKTIE